MLIRFVKYIYCLCLIAVDKLFTVSVKKKEGIALVRLDAIGDFVIWSHSAPEYRQHYKKEKIILIANSIWSDRQ